MSPAINLVTTSLLAVLAMTSAHAKDARRDEPVAQADPAPVSAEPQQTSASFGDWVVRCDHPAPVALGTGKRVCEAAQSLIVKGQQGPIAQIAFGHMSGDKYAEPALTLTVLLPVSVAFDKPPKLGPGAGADDPGSASLAFRRCLPGGCLADAKPDAALLKDLRAAGKPGHLSFTDAAERTITLPVSLRGLAQALDDLAKETGKEAGR